MSVRVQASLGVLSGPVASADSDETTEELDANEEVEDTADTLSFKVLEAILSLCDKQN